MRRDQRSPAAQAYRPLYNTAIWRSIRAAQLRKQSLCEPCEKQGRTVRATVVHHKREHKGDWSLFVDQENLESVCKPCHDGPAQQVERIGYSTEIGVDGWPIDQRHPAIAMKG